MNKVLDGKIVAKKIREEIEEKLSSFKEHYTPKVAIIRVGEKQDDISYENSIINNCKKIGIQYELHKLDQNVEENNLYELIDDLNYNPSIDSIMIFRPLPKHINDNFIRSIIAPQKDIDCINQMNLEDIFEGVEGDFKPCTAEAVMELLNYYEIDLEGKLVAILGRSLTVGKPLSMMLLHKNATPIICHSKTNNLKEVTSQCDIVISAIGKPKFLTQDFIKEGAIVIDVGINIGDDGKICGDVDYNNVYEKASAITPVPGGIGPITNILLLRNIIKSC